MYGTLRFPHFFGTMGSTLIAHIIKTLISVNLNMNFVYFINFISDWVSAGRFPWRFSSSAYLGHSFLSKLIVERYILLPMLKKFLNRLSELVVSTNFIVPIRTNNFLAI